jgi:hypothetical protein
MALSNGHKKVIERKPKSDVSDLSLPSHSGPTMWEGMGWASPSHFSRCVWEIFE